MKASRCGNESPERSDRRKAGRKGGGKKTKKNNTACERQKAKNARPGKIFLTMVGNEAAKSCSAHQEFCHTPLISTSKDETHFTAIKKKVAEDVD